MLMAIMVMYAMAHGPGRRPNNRREPALGPSLARAATCACLQRACLHLRFLAVASVTSVPLPCLTRVASPACRAPAPRPSSAPPAPLAAAGPPSLGDAGARGHHLGVLRVPAHDGAPGLCTRVGRGARARAERAHSVQATATKPARFGYATRLLGLLLRSYGKASLTLVRRYFPNTGGYCATGNSRLRSRLATQGRSHEQAN